MKLVLKTSVLIFLLSTCQTAKRSIHDEYTFTVNGKISVKELGFSLTHEHIMSNFGAEPEYIPRYDQGDLFGQVVPYLKNVKSQGITTVFDCTAAYFGRDVHILKALADSTGLQIVTNTGFYAAASDRYVPELAYRLNAEEIAKIWIGEFKNGIDDTGIRPGFVKLAFDGGAPSEIDLKLFRAGILTHLSTGLPLVVHTGNNVEAARRQLELLEKSNLSPTAWIWAHADKVEDVEELLSAAERGAWISLDGVKQENITDYLRKIDLFKSRGLLHKVLLSHDGNSFPRGGAIRPYDAIPKALLPALKAHGYPLQEINQLMVENPQRAFGIRVRRM
ncbi:phosphotriesterase [Persicitalea sp.]|uniref:phosphotriesterase family protein n=1 Tax=Persicitalea sp. TaxID=3100273 RepID=UPI0035948E0E